MTCSGTLLKSYSFLLPWEGQTHLRNYSLGFRILQLPRQTVSKVV